MKIYLFKRLVTSKKKKVYVNVNIQADMKFQIRLFDRKYVKYSFTFVLWFMYETESSNK